MHIYYFAANKKPEMSELNKYLVKYCGLWRAIGLKLGLEDDLLETIARDNPKHQECFRVMLQKWLIQDVSATWNTLELAITNAQRDDLSLDNLTESMFDVENMYVHMYVYNCVTRSDKTHLPHTWQYFKKYHFKILFEFNHTAGCSWSSCIVSN